MYVVCTYIFLSKLCFYIHLHHSIKYIYNLIKISARFLNNFWKKVKSYYLHIHIHTYFLNVIYICIMKQNLKICKKYELTIKKLESNRCIYFLKLVVSEYETIYLMSSSICWSRIKNRYCLYLHTSLTFKS